MVCFGTFDGPVMEAVFGSSCRIMWFYDIKDSQWHRSPGPVGEKALCGQRWGATAVDSSLLEPDYGEKCGKCRKILDLNEKV